MYLCQNRVLLVVDRCLKDLEGLEVGSADERIGVEIVRRALRVPCANIASNAGVESSLIVERLLQSKNPSEGYDALRDKFVDMIEAGESKTMCSLSVSHYHISCTTLRNH